LTPTLINHLRTQDPDILNRKRHTVYDLSYAGDEGGIVCHLSRPDETGTAHVVSLTHLHVPRSMPLAATVAAYQKHRSKKIKKQNRM
jgi:hypothetical protein